MTQNNEFYAEEYAIADAGVPFEELGDSPGVTIYTQSAVFVIPPKYQNRFPRSLRVVGMCPAWGTLFTES